MKNGPGRTIFSIIEGYKVFRAIGKVIRMTCSLLSL